MMRLMTTLSEGLFSSTPSKSVSHPRFAVSLRLNYSIKGVSVPLETPDWVSGVIERGEYISYRSIDISQIVTLYRIYRYHLADGRGKGGSMTSCEFDRRRRNDARRDPQRVVSL